MNRQLSSIKIPVELFEKLHSLIFTNGSHNFVCDIGAHAIYLNWFDCCRISCGVVHVFFLHFVIILVSLRFALCTAGMLHADRHISNGRYIISWLKFEIENYNFMLLLLLVLLGNDCTTLQSRLNRNNRTEAILMHTLLSIYLKVFNANRQQLPVLYRLLWASHC